MFSDVVTRLLAVVKTLASAHLQLAQQEAGRDLTRLVLVLLCLVLALLFGSVAWLAANVLGVVIAVNQLWLTPASAIAVAFGLNGGAALVLVAMARARLQRPVLEETRGLLRKTANSFTS